MNDSRTAISRAFVKGGRIKKVSAPKTAPKDKSLAVWKIERAAFLKLCEGVNTPRSIACYMMFVAGEYDQYLNLAMPDTDSDSFPDDYFVSEAMRKNPRLPTTIKTRSVAFEKWLAAEDLCSETNDEILSYMEGRPSRLDPINDLITKIQSVIADILGPLDAKMLQRVESGFRFGPGATSTCSGRDVVTSRKMLSSFAMTPRLYPYWPSILGKGRWGISVRDISLSHGSTLTFAPKDAKTDRAICIEPHGNIFVQLGIGGAIRHLLRRAGLDLDVQADVNRQLVLLAEALDLATVDLSSASDTIAYRLIWLLLPHDWALLLDTARSPFCNIGSRTDPAWKELEKFSSMGNGFTFELESLIFWALAKVSGDPNAVAFGDDIIIDRCAVPTLLDALNRLGFKVNERKTFLAGRFFESCGVDVWRGRDVRPFYFKKEVSNVSSHLIRIANRIRIYAHRRNFGYGCDVRFLPAWLYVVHRDAQVNRTALPPGFGDDGLIKNFDESTPSRAKHQFEGWFTTVLKPTIVRSRRTVRVGAYCAALAWGSPRMTRLFETKRGSSGEATLKRQLVPHWRNLGPWC